MWRQDTGRAEPRLKLFRRALRYGAEFDAELERGRQLQAGIAAEEDISLPPRDTRKSDRAAEKEQKDIEDGRQIRHQHAEEDNTGGSGQNDQR